MAISELSWGNVSYLGCYEHKMEYFELFCLKKFQLLCVWGMIYICVHTYTMSRLKIKVSLGSFSSGRIYEVMIIINIFYSPEIFQSGNCFLEHKTLFASSCGNRSAVAVRLSTGMSVQEVFQDIWQPEVSLSYWSRGQVLAELHGRKPLTKYRVAVAVIKYRMIKKAEVMQCV